MNTLKFKTTIKCSGCLQKVTPALNEKAGEGKWSVDLQSPQRVLTVNTEKLSATDIQQAVHKAGFIAEPITGQLP